MFATLQDYHHLLQCFLNYYFLFNVTTAPHRDIKDPPHGWAAMVVLGNFTWEDLCFPDLGIALPYQSRDIIFLSSSALKHFSRYFQGEFLYVIVFSMSHDDAIFQWLEDLQVRPHGI